MPRRAREDGGDADAEDEAAKRVRSPYAKGAIYRVKLHNFMSYTDAEIVDPGPQLNCIIGANGTGKSSIPVVVQLQILLVLFFSSPITKLATLRLAD